MRVKRAFPGVLSVLSVWMLTMPSPTRAQAVITFNPRLILEYFIDDNVVYVGNERVEDDGFRVQLDFPVERQTRRSNFLFAYSPLFTKFQTFDELDNLGHYLESSLDYEASERSSWTLGANYRLTQVQADPNFDSDADLFLTPRDERELLSGRIGFEHGLSSRWVGNVELGADDNKYRTIEDFDPGPEIIPREDKREYRGRLGLRREMSPKTLFGASYRYRQYELEILSDETVHAVTLDLDHQPSPKWSLQLSLGPFQRQKDVEDETSNGVYADFGAVRTFQAYTLSFSARNYPSGGGAIAGTSTNTSFQLALSPNLTRKVTWNAVARWARRDPTDELETLIETGQVGGMIWYRFAKILGVRFGAYYVDQTTDGLPAFEGFVFRGGLGLIWYPLAGTRFAPLASTVP